MPPTALVMVLAQWPQVMSGTWKLTIDASFRVDAVTINPPTMSRSRLFFGLDLPPGGRFKVSM
jgi:hypothetical protein